MLGRRLEWEFRVDTVSRHIEITPGGEAISFYMDEHVPRSVTEGLRRRGVDVLTAQEAGALGVDDEQHVALALRHGRVIFMRPRMMLPTAVPCGA